MDRLQNSSRKTKVLSRVFQVILILSAFLAVFVTFFAFRAKPKIDYSQSDFVQLEEPSDDATVVVFETTEGVIKAVLYEDEAPKYCEYFKELVKEGYFDDTYVCAVLKTAENRKAGFIGGSKTTDGIANDDTNTKMTSIEISGNMLPVKGSLCSLVKQSGIFSRAKAGSVVTFVNDVVDVEELDKSLEGQSDNNGLKRVTDIFKKYGGAPNFLQAYTIFGQIYDGWDTVDKISSAEIQDEGVSDDESDKNYSPKSEIRFTKVYLSTYGEQKQNGFNIPEKAAE